GASSLSLRSCHITFHAALALPSLNFLSHSASPTNNNRLPRHSISMTTLVLFVTLAESSANAKALDIIRDCSLRNSAPLMLLGNATGTTDGAFENSAPPAATPSDLSASAPR